MKFESKYNFGDKVYTITNNKRKDIRSCRFCGGKGMIVGANTESRLCPECYGRRVEHYWIDEGWRVDRKLTIGEIRIRHRCKSNGEDPDSIFSNYGPQEEEYEEEYMCNETGIGSGYVLKVERLWATKEEAQAECDRLNELLKVAV